MKGKFRNQSGITLIALIITIIILVILAAVSIRAVYNQGIVGIAANGVQDYTRASVAEQKEMRDTMINTMIAEYRLKNILNGTTLAEYLASKGYEVTDNGDGTLSFEEDGYTVTIDTESLSYTSEKASKKVRIAFLKDGQESSAAAEAMTGETLKGTKTLTLHAVVMPDNASDKTVTWESSDTDVATVAFVIGFSVLCLMDE